MLQPTLSSIYLLGAEINRALEESDVDNQFRLVGERQKLIDMLPAQAELGHEHPELHNLKEALRQQDVQIALESRKAEQALTDQLDALRRFREAERGYRDSLDRQRRLLDSRLRD